MTTDAPIDRLELANAHGLFAIRSASATVYYYSADTRELLRAPGDSSGTGPYDHCWNHLEAVSSEQDTGVITVGRRHRWDLDPNPGQPGMTIWWIQHTVTSIERLPKSARPVGRGRAGGWRVTDGDMNNPPTAIAGPR